MPTRRTDSLLLAREAWGLRVTASARICMVLVFSVMDLWLAQSTVERVASAMMVTVIVGINATIYLLSRQMRRLALLGILGVCIDIAALIAGPTSWYLGALSTGGEAQLGFLVKAPLASMALLFIAVNGLALRPLYPALVTVAATAGFAVVSIIALSDPRTMRSEEVAVVFSSPALSVGLVVAVALVLAVGGGMVVMVTAIARRTVREAVGLERRNVELREAQAEVVAQEKLQALARLVAGIAHEVNSPLGAVSCSSSTSGQALSRLRALLEGAEDLESLRKDRRLERLLGALEQGSEVTHEAGARIGEVLRTLERFIALDASERRELHLGEAIEDSLALLKHKLGRRIVIERDLEQAPTVLCHPARIHQLLAAVLENAVEALARGGKRGRLTISACSRAEPKLPGTEAAAGPWALLSIVDTGPGIAPDRLESLFDVRFSESGGARVHAGMSLAISRAIARQHGGEIHLESKLGQGTRVFIQLPATPPSGHDVPA